jgi:hypothetical protein
VGLEEELVAGEDLNLAGDGGLGGLRGSGARRHCDGGAERARDATQAAGGAHSPEAARVIDDHGEILLSEVGGRGGAKLSDNCAPSG